MEVELAKSQLGDALLFAGDSSMLVDAEIADLGASDMANPDTGTSFVEMAGIEQSSLFEAPEPSTLVHADLAGSMLLDDAVEGTETTEPEPEWRTTLQTDLETDLEVEADVEMAVPENRADDDRGSDYSFTIPGHSQISLQRRTRNPPPPPKSVDRNYYGINIHQLIDRIENEKVAAESTASKPSPKAPDTNGSLLSEKWRPKRWVDLLGSERSHRQMLRWLVSWSHVVFQTDLPDQDELFNRDRLGRPFRKILLIHGPPGIGKTTVAHIIAKQAGYDVLEINASDERSGHVIREKITGAVESHRVGKSHKPVCVIADEVEGAAENGFIRVLVDLVTSDQKALAAENRGKPSRKSKKKSRLLLRPIIAICNDLYANSLRTLRPHAEIISYTKSSQAAIVTKLREVCSSEKLALNTEKLTDIVSASDGDLRSSLNMLQFGADSVFLKDLNKSWTKVTNRIFKRTDGRTTAEDLRDIATGIRANGEYDRIATGCFNLFPSVHFHDDMVRKPGLIGDWLHFYEQINAQIYGNQHGQVAEYLDQPLLAFYSLFSSPTNVKDLPVHTDYEIRESTKANEQMCKDVLASISPATRVVFNRQQIATELAPYALRIVNPVVDGVGSTLRDADKSRISNSAVAMSDLNLRFFRDKLENGASTYRLDPPLEQLVVFDEAERQRLAVGRFSTRQQILDCKVGGTKRLADDDETTSSDKRQKVESTKKTAVIADFFGRDVVTEDLTPTQAAAAVTKVNDRVWIQFVEGFSNAVRKDITWEDLW